MCLIGTSKLHQLYLCLQIPFNTVFMSLIICQSKIPTDTLSHYYTVAVLSTQSNCCVPVVVVVVAHILCVLHPQTPLTAFISTVTAYRQLSLLVEMSPATKENVHETSNSSGSCF